MTLAMNEDTRAKLLVAALFAIVLGIVALQVFLFIIFDREQVKKDLRGRFCQPISIRWHISFWETRYATHFRAVYSDLGGSIHKAECRVYRRLMDNPFFGSFQVQWLRDEIIGRTPASEVQVDSN
jgi:hypothetical protein